MPEDQILWFEGVYKLEADLRKDFEENNSEDTKKMPRDAIIKLAYHTNETMYIPNKLRKKFPAICDPNKLRNTKSQLMSFYGSTKTNYIIRDAEIQLKNLERVRDFMRKIEKDQFTEIHDNKKIPLGVANDNINYTNVNFKHLIDLLNIYEAPEEIQVDIDSLQNFILENRKELENWSVVLVNRGNREMDGFKWEMKDFDGNNKQISPVKRKWEDVKSGSTENVLFFSQILEGRSRDISFDLIDDDNRGSFIIGEITNSDARKYRNEKKKPILVIYPVFNDKDEKMLFPLLFFIIPIINGGKKVRYLVRNQRD